MNIYELNYLTKTNILLYQEEEPLFVFYRLLKDCLHDAIILYDIYKWKRIHCTSIPFLKWIKENNVIIELTNFSIKELLQNGDKEVLDYIDPKDYVFQILLSNPPFIQHVLENYSIIIEDSYLVELSKGTTIDKYNTFLVILPYVKLSVQIIIDCLYYLSQYNELNLVQHLLSLKPQIIKQYSLKSFFYKSLTYNQYELSTFFLSLDASLIHCIDSILIQLFVNQSYKTLDLLYIMNKSLFSNINHNYIFEMISIQSIQPNFINWYVKRFRFRIDNNLYYRTIENYTFMGYILDNVPITDECFIHACSQNYLTIVKSYKGNDNIRIRGFGIAALFGYLDIVEYLSMDKDILYKVLHNLIELDSIHIHIVKYICNKIIIHPPKLMLYLCKHGDINWISDKELDDECIYMLCLNGHFTTIYDLYIHCKIDEHLISDAFFHSCENGKGLYIAKWLYYTNYLTKQTIHRAFFNSSDINTLKWLHSVEFIPIRKNNNAYFIESCLNYELSIITWLCEIYPNYSYTIVDGVIHYNIDLFKISKNIKQTECCICLETNTNAMTICKHDFCYDCINEWYKKNNSCPMCREKMDEVYFLSPLQKYELL